MAAAITSGLGWLWVNAPDFYEQGEGRLQAIALTRTGVLTAAAGLLVLANLLESRRATNLTHTRELAEQAETRRANDLTHTRELYARAVDQLGSITIDIRLGGIYALERLARDSPPDQRTTVQRTVVEVLSAFVRVRSTDPELRPAPPATPDGPEPAATSAEPVRPAVDVHAAVTVLARLPFLKEVPRADLTGANLTGPAALHRLHVPPGGSLAGVDLTDADLSGARLAVVDLTDARLDRANLTRAWLGGANLAGARLDEANLTSAQLNRADLSVTQLDGANLSGARLVEADLTATRLDGADLTDARLGKANLKTASLEKANLTGAHLGEANLFLTNLAGADLTDAELTQGQLDAALGNASTVLPAGRLERPPSWPAEDEDTDS